MKRRYHIVYRTKDDKAYMVDYSKKFFESHGDRITETLTNVWGKPMSQWDVTIESLTRIY